MGVRILAGALINERDQPAACLYCSTTGVAFGPIFCDADEAESFLAFLATHDCDDPRRLTPRQLDDAHTRWLAAEGTRDVLDALASADTEPVPGVGP